MTYPPLACRADPLSAARSLAVWDQPGAVRRGRGFVRESCTELGFDETLCYTAALLTSETVTNALFHAGSCACVTVTASGNGLLVEVEDEGQVMPHQPLAPDLEALGGRGLQIVEELATEWGSYPRGLGKVVWFHLAAA